MNVGIIFGGKSCEHDISIITAVQAMGHLNVKHKCVPIYVDNKGVWLIGKDFDKHETFQKTVKGKKVHLRPQSNALYSETGRKLHVLDAVILCNHGMNGEDGTVAGVLELSGIPYAGSNVRASAVGMDKITLKHLLRGLGVPVTKYVPLDKYKSPDIKAAARDLSEGLGFPIIIKPSNLGSSIGISIARNAAELETALEVAFHWDTRVIAEEALTDFIEVNCAVLGYGGDYTVSEVEQPTGWKEFLSFSDKYEGGFKGASSRNMPANISAELRERVRTLARATFDAIGASGVARVDFLIKDEIVYVNEINTIPGSLSNYLFSFDGLSFTALLDKLIEFAQTAHKDKSGLTYTYKPTRQISGSKK